MEKLYHSISKAINIDDNREKYTNLYDFVRIAVINGLKQDEIFKIIFADINLAGSYRDNLKVTSPNEFDLVVRLEFPYHDQVHLEEDFVNIGNVWINLINVINKVGRIHPKKEILLKFFDNIVNDDGYLLLDKFQSWFEKILTKYLNRIQSELSYNDEVIYLKYSKHGPAHTIFVQGELIEISIDFVPGFRFDKSQAITPKYDLINFDDKWEAVPKPIIGKSSNPSLQCSYTESEEILLSGRNQFKNTLRMMKKFRDMDPALVNLKSYFIKTLFLWHSESKTTAYWNCSNTMIMDEMFEVLEKALKERVIKFYWDERVNLLRFLSHNQIDEMYYHVRNARKILSKRSDLQRDDLKRIKDLFLTEEEQKDISPQLEQEIEKSFWDIAKETVDSFSSYLPYVAGIAAGAFVVGTFFSRWNRNNNNN